MKQSSLKILVVEDDDLQRHNLAKQLSSQGHEIQQAASKAQALDKISNEQFDLSFVDLDLDERKAGFDLIPLLKRKGVYSVILSGHREEAYVEEGYGKECDDYLTKPFRSAAVDEILSNYRGSSQKARLRKLILQKMITQDPEHLQQFEILIESMGIKKLPILITGPSGVGKSVLAEILHEGWYGHKNHFVEVNADGLSDSLLQSELLGHVDGAFTGANKKKLGKIAEANQGTLFIDEIGTIGIRMQHTLLVPLANGHFSPVGSNERHYSEFKLITATCEDLHEKIAAKQFREDFFNRISGVTVKFKPLKERPKDIELLLSHVQKNFGDGRGMAIRPSAKKALLDYDWPGNEREFFDFWKAKAKAKKPVFSVEDLPQRIVTNSYPGKHAYNLLTERQIKYVEEVGLKTFLSELEKEVADHFRRKLGKDRPIRPLMRHLGYSQKKVTSLLNGLKEAEV